MNDNLRFAEWYAYYLPRHSDEPIKEVIRGAYYSGYHAGVLGLEIDRTIELSEVQIERRQAEQLNPTAEYG